MIEPEEPRRDIVEWIEKMFGKGHRPYKIEPNFTHCELEKELYRAMDWEYSISFEEWWAGIVEEWEKEKENSTPPT